MDNTNEDPGLSEAWNRAWASVATQVDAAARQSHPRIKPWRQAWKRIGVSSKKFPYSIESLVKRALKGGEPFSINPIVDFYNTVSLRHIAPAGAFDFNETDDAIELRLTRPGDTFLALDHTNPEPIPEGETAYAAGPIVLTRHFVWKQSQQVLIQPTTSHVFLVSEILGESPDDVAHAVRRDFDVDCESFVLDEDNLEASWAMA